MIKFLEMSKKEYTLLYIFVLITAIITGYIERILDIEYPNSLLREYNPMLLVFVAVIVAPIIEEIMFRYFIKRGKLMVSILAGSILMALLMVNNIYLKIFYILLNIIAFLFYYITNANKLPIYLTIFYAILFCTYSP